MSLRLIAVMPLLLLGACSLLPFSGSKPAPPAATSAKPFDPAAGVDYVQRPSADNRQALAELHAALAALQSDPNLGSRAPDAMKQATIAVAAADKLQSNADHPPNFVEVVTGEAQMYQVDVRPLAHLLYLADRRVQIARALAEASFFEDQARELRAKRDAAAGGRR